MTHRRILAFAAALISTGAVPSSGERIAATGVLAGFPIATTVDSPDARDLLAGGDRSGNPLSIDAAAIALVRRRLDDDERSRDAQQRFLDELARQRRGREIRARLRGWQFLLVPGFLYRRDPSTGADLARQIKVLRDAGLDAQIIEVDEAAPVEANAAFIASAITNGDREVVLVSASKGGPEAALALASLPADAARRVKAWVSVGGIHRGTPLADSGLRWPKRWLARLLLGGGAVPALQSMTVQVRRAAWERIALPAGVEVLQLVAVPLSGHVSPDVRRRWRALSAFGPNDGVTLLADELIPGSRAVFLPGADHYYRHPELDAMTLALANVAADLAP